MQALIEGRAGARPSREATPLTAGLLECASTPRLRCQAPRFACWLPRFSASPRCGQRCESTGQWREDACNGAAPVSEQWERRRSPRRPASHRGCGAPKREVSGGIARTGRSASADDPCRFDSPSGHGRGIKGGPDRCCLPDIAREMRDGEGASGLDAWCLARILEAATRSADVSAGDAVMETVHVVRCPPGCVSGDPRAGRPRSAGFFVPQILAIVDARFQS